MAAEKKQRPIDVNRALAKRIDEYLKRFEKDPRINVRDRAGSTLFYMASATATAKYVMVRERCYSLRWELKTATAEDYLAWLDAGNAGTYSTFKSGRIGDGFENCDSAKSFVGSMPVEAARATPLADPKATMIEAIRHTLDRAQTDAAFRRQVIGTETFDRLIAAEAAIDVRPVDAVRAERLVIKHSPEKDESQLMREFFAEHEIDFRAGREDLIEQFELAAGELRDYVDDGE